MQVLQITLDEAREQGIPLFGFCTICKQHKPNDYHTTSIDICDDCYKKGLCAVCGGEIEKNSMNWRCKKCQRQWNKMLKEDIGPFFKKLGVI